MPFHVRHATNSLLQRGFKEARADLSPMKVQKLLFFLNGWHLAVEGSAAIDTPFEAWPYGPVVPAIYHELKEFRGQPVSKYIKDPAWDRSEAKAYVVNQTCKSFYEVLDLTWEKYIGFSALQLSAMTHDDGTPWAITSSAGGGPISDAVTKDYFVSLAHGRA